MVEKEIEKLVDIVVCLLEDSCESGILCMKVHRSNHLCDGLEKVDNMKVLDAARYGHFIVVIKRAYCKPTMKRAPGMRYMTSALR